MSMILTIHQAEIPDNRFYPLWLERVFGHLTNAALSLYHLVLYFINLIIMVITLGAPYLHYKLYRHGGNEADPGETYSQMLKELDIFWDQHSKFLLPIILPVLFPMVSLSGVTACSVASFMATMTFTVGAASIGTRIIFKIKARALHNEHAIHEWQRASETPWRKVPNKSFWILFSLPTVVFFLSMGLLIATVVLTFWERPVVGVTPRPGILEGCTMKRLRGFRYMLLTVLVGAVVHFGFVIVKLHLLSGLRNAGSTSVA